MEFAHNFKHRVISTVDGKGVVHHYTTTAQRARHARVGKIEVPSPAPMIMNN